MWHGKLAVQLPSLVDADRAVCTSCGTERELHSGRDRFVCICKSTNAELLAEKVSHRPKAFPKLHCDQKGDALPMKHSLTCLAGLQMHCRTAHTMSRFAGASAICKRGLSGHNSRPTLRPGPQSQQPIYRRCLTVSKRVDKLRATRADI